MRIIVEHITIQEASYSNRWSSGKKSNIRNAKMTEAQKTETGKANHRGAMNIHPTSLFSIRSLVFTFTRCDIPKIQSSATDLVSQSFSSAEETANNGYIAHHSALLLLVTAQATDAE